MKSRSGLQNVSKLFAYDLRRRAKGEGKLTYVDDECMDIFRHFFIHGLWETLIRGMKLLHIKKLRFMVYGKCFLVRNAERQEYWYHFHFGSDHSDSVGYHMFFGTNDYGEVPVDL